MNDIANIPGRSLAKICRECIEINSINFAGNVIPKSWFKSITYPSGKADMLAINILSEIVYWYRLIEECDEATGKVIGYRQRFYADMLQRSYQGFADMFGVSRRQVKMAIDRLKDKELVKIEFRNVKANNIITNNVMYIKPVPERVRAITCPPSYIQMQEGVHSNVTGPAFECRTNTKNTTKNTYDDNNYNIRTNRNSHTKKSSSPSFFQEKKEKTDKPEPDWIHPYFPPVNNETEAEILAREVMDYQISTGTKVPEEDRQRYLFTLIKKAKNGTLIVPRGYKPPAERKKEEDQILKSKKDRRMKEKAEQDQMEEERTEQENALISFLLLPKERQEEFIKLVKSEDEQGTHLMPESMINRRAAVLYAKGGMGQ